MPGGGLHEGGDEHIRVEDVTIAYGDVVVQKDLSFAIRRGEVFVIMGGSGCGKSSLMRVMIGLLRPALGDVFYSGEPFWDGEEEVESSKLRGFGVLFQAGALWSSMTLAENVALPLTEHTELDDGKIEEICRLKLALVGLAGFEHYYPSEISGGMRKRAGLARAMALDPEILFFDEPSAGLDPITSRRLDELIVELADSLGTTVVVVTHELASIHAIGDDSVFLDAETKTMLATGNPKALRDEAESFKVRNFLRRGELAREGRETS